ncbi:MAG: NADP-dependent oxidoreductase [Gemmatimonadetes bacterium]|jgi:NADPH:quinone reductase|nr:NADP-dependent oxidoreductase [Gemmatimonadota bacterium]
MSSGEISRRIVLAKRPSGLPLETDFRLEETPIPSPADGQILVRNQFLSVDPYMRGRMNEGASYAPGLELGEVMVGGVVGEVIESRASGFKPGDIAQTQTGWQEFAVSDIADARRVDPALAPISTSLGVLGMPGITAWVGLLDIGRPRDGETVVVSGAAGAVGSLVGQIARITGCRAIGITGTDAKISYLTDELGFDGAINYRTQDVSAALSEFCPDGIDVYFDNVGGEISDSVLQQMNEGGRISVCGQISQYNLADPETGPRLTWLFIVKRLMMRGFLVFDHSHRYIEALREMATWLADGRLQYREDVIDGLENAPAAFIGMLQGDNTGKRLVRLAT